MKITSGVFIDCIGGNESDKQKFSEFKHDILFALPTLFIADMARILIIRVKSNMFLVKARQYCPKIDLDQEKIYKDIIESDFIEISRKDYCNNSDPKYLLKRTEELIGFNNNVIFNMDDYYIDRRK